MEVGLVGLYPPAMALGSPWPSRTLSIGWHRTGLRYDDRSLVCVRRCSTTRLAPRSSASSSFQPDIEITLEVRPCLPRFTVSRVARPSGPSHDVSSEFPKIAPSQSQEPRSPLPTCTSPCLLRRPVASRSRVPSSWFSTTLTAYSSSTLSGYCTGVPVMGFVAFRAARRRCPRHEVLPFEAFILTRSRQPWMANHPAAGPTSPNEFPRWFTVYLASSSLLPGPRGFSLRMKPFPMRCCHHGVST